MVDGGSCLVNRARLPVSLSVASRKSFYILLLLILLLLFLFLLLRLMLYLRLLAVFLLYPLEDNDHIFFGDEFATISATAFASAIVSATATIAISHRHRCHHPCTYCFVSQPFVLSITIPFNPSYLRANQQAASN